MATAAVPPEKWQVRAHVPFEKTCVQADALLRSWSRKFGELNRPRRFPLVRVLTLTKRFNYLVAAVICASVIELILEVDAGETRCHSTSEVCFNVLGLVSASFLMFFIVELVLRYLGEDDWRRFFFTSRDAGWHWFDFLIVVPTVIFESLRLIPSKPGSFINNMQSQCHRASMVLKMLRLVRIFRHFERLWLILETLIEAMKTAVWVMVLAVFFLLVFAILCTQAIGHRPEYWTDPEESFAISVYFGDVERSMFTLFQVLTMDNWSGIVQLVGKKMPIMSPVFFVFVIFMGFTLVSLFTGVVVNYMTVLCNVKRRNARMDERAIMRFSQMFPDDCDIHDFVRIFSERRKKRELHIEDMDFTPEEARHFFGMFDRNDDGRISGAEFSAACYEYRRGLTIMSTLRLTAIFRDLNAQAAKDPASLCAAPLRLSPETEASMDAATVWIGRLEGELSQCEQKVATLGQLVRAWQADGEVENDADSDSVG